MSENSDKPCPKCEWSGTGKDLAPHLVESHGWRAVPAAVFAAMLSGEPAVDHAQRLSDAIFGDGTSLLGKADP